MKVPVIGILLKCFKKPPYEDKKTGEIGPDKFAIQVLVEETLKNGSIVNEIYDINIDKDKFNKYEQDIGKKVNLECLLWSKSPITLTVK